MDAWTWPYWCLLALAAGALTPPPFWIGLLAPLLALSSPRAGLLVALLLVRGWWGVQPAPRQPLGEVQGLRAQVVARVCEPAVPTTRGCRFVAEVHHWTDRPWGFGGRWLVDWKGGSAGDVSMGDLWHLRGKLVGFAPPAYPGDFDAARVWGRRGVSQRLRVSAADFVRPPESDSPGAAVLEWRARLTRRMADRLPAERAGLLSAVVYGDGSRVSTALNDAFRQAGVSHLLVASGANVAVLVAWICLLGKLLGYGPRRCAGVCLWLTPAYVLLAGAAPAMVRAGAMSWVALLARSTGLATGAGRCLTLGTLAVLIWDPNYLYDLGFQLSFGAVAALAWLQPRVALWTGGRWPMVTATVACALGLVPISWTAFGCLQPMAILSNLWMGPLTESLLPVGLGWSALDLAWPLAGKWLAWPLDRWLWLVQHSAEWWARWSWQLDTPAPTPAGWAAWGLLLATVWCGPRLLCLLPVALAPWLCWWPRPVIEGLDVRCLQLNFAPCFWLRQGDAQVALLSRAEQRPAVERMGARAGPAAWAQVLVLGVDQGRWRWGRGWLQADAQRLCYHEPPFSVALGGDAPECSWSVTDKGVMRLADSEPAPLLEGHPWRGLWREGRLDVGAWTDDG